MAVQWNLVLFTLFNCLSAGTFAAIAISAILGKGEKIQMPGLLTAFAALAVGGIASFLHLQTPSRLFGQFANITSGITLELIMTVVIGIVMVAYFVVLRNKKPVSKVLAWIAVAVSVVFVLVMSASYLMPSRPVWDTFLLPVYYLVQSAVFGAFAALVIAKMTGEDGALVDLFTKGALISTGALAVVVAAYTVHIGSVMGDYVGSSYVVYHVGPFTATDASTGFSRMISGDLAAVFWGLVVVVGLAVPAGVLAAKKSASSFATLAGVGLVAALAGGVAFRVILYVIGSTVMKF